MQLALKRLELEKYMSDPTKKNHLDQLLNGQPVVEQIPVPPGPPAPGYMWAMSDQGFTMVPVQVLAQQYQPPHYQQPQQEMRPPVEYASQDKPPAIPDHIGDPSDRKAFLALYDAWHAGDARVKACVEDAVKLLYGTVGRNALRSR